MARTPQQDTTFGETDNATTGSTGNRAAGSQAPKYSRSESGGSDKGVVAKAGEALMSTAEQQKAAGADFVSGMAGAVRRAAGEFDGQLPQAANYIRYAADQIDSMSESVRRRDIGQLVSDLQSMARRQPSLFLGATFLAGFAAIRFLKSSSESSVTRYDRSDDDDYGDAGRYDRPASMPGERSTSQYPM